MATYMMMVFLEEEKNKITIYFLFERSLLVFGLLILSPVKKPMFTGCLPRR